MVSFIVPAYNEELELPQTLAAIRAASEKSGETYEIIVADDGSTDSTATLATLAGARVVKIQRRQIAAARNAGAREARGDILFFVDADTHIAAGHVTGALNILRSGCAGGGARMVVDGDISRWMRAGTVLFCAVYFAANLGAGAFLFTTRANFERIGGFDEQYFAGEEIYFTKALKKIGRFCLLREPVVTSGRKLRMHSPRNIFWQCIQITLSGGRAIRSREKLDLWYDGKREEIASEV